MARAKVKIVDAGWITTACQRCNGDGGFDSHPRSYNPVTGEPHTRWIVCDWCNGSGEHEARCQFRTLEDIEAEEADGLTVTQ